VKSGRFSCLFADNQRLAKISFFGDFWAEGKLSEKYRASEHENLSVFCAFLDFLWHSDDDVLSVWSNPYFVVLPL
jgi:hypothetical protein